VFERTAPAANIPLDQLDLAAGRMRCLRESGERRGEVDSFNPPLPHRPGKSRGGPNSGLRNPKFVFALQPVSNSTLEIRPSGTLSTGEGRGEVALDPQPSTSQTVSTPLRMAGGTLKFELETPTHLIRPIP
jgi:hypothetical protein